MRCTIFELLFIADIATSFIFHFYTFSHEGQCFDIFPLCYSFFRYFSLSTFFPFDVFPFDIFPFRHFSLSTFFFRHFSFRHFYYTPCFSPFKRSPNVQERLLYPLQIDLILKTVRKQSKCSIQLEKKSHR